jgi:hypothetical protein
MYEIADEKSGKESRQLMRYGKKKLRGAGLPSLTVVI